MSWVDRLKATDVKSPETLGRYAQQQIGTPYPRKKEIAVLRFSVNEFFAEYPHATYQSLCNVVLWAKEKHKRYAHTNGLIRHGFRLAYADGYLPELEPRNRPDHIDNLIVEATKIEEDREWISLLCSGATEEAKWNIYETWKKERV